MNGHWIDLGRMAYGPAWGVQRELADQVTAGRRPDTLLLVEHDPVLTLGASFHTENLIYPEAFYKARGIALERTDRGGDVTYHGPDQLVAYPIFDLSRHGKDLHLWMRTLEEAVIRALASWGLEGSRNPPHTGVWLGDRKVCAIGVKVKRWVSTHGVALNCNNDLLPFRMIVPCGIRDFGVTSVSEATGREVGIDEARPRLIAGFESAFGLNLERTEL